MHVPLSWLAEWIALPADLEELCHHLTMGGLEVDDIIRTGPALDGIVVGHVLSREPHPNADRLALCKVAYGGAEAVDVVCGAPNVAAGQKIAFAPVGTVMPDGTKLKKAKLRGVVSRGMICSERELEMSDEHAGILVLDDDAPVGAALRETLGAGDTVLEIALTANRGDCASILGIAREVAAHFGGELQLPPLEAPEGSRAVDDDIRIQIEAGDGCWRYAGRIVRGLRVGPSPDWLAARIEAAGFRSINNVVDLTNYVLLELGQPLHAFDLAKLEGGQVGVRWARAGETLETLDGERRGLREDDLVITDAALPGGRPIALAGVMGGANSEVSETTTDILIESAHFAPEAIRRTARRLGLHSDASYRFERGVDREGIEQAANRAARLVAEICGGEISRGVALATGTPPAPVAEIELSPARVNRLLGTQIAEAQIEQMLGRLGIETRSRGGTLVAQIPSYRNDLEAPVDLIEEVARIHGVDNIEPAPAVGVLDAGAVPATWALAEAARDLLATAGLTEIMSFPFLDPADLDKLRLESDDPRRRLVRVLNPIVDSDSHLRPSALPSLLRLMRENANRQIDRVAIFEVCRAFLPGAREEGLPDEPLTVTALFNDAGDPALWQARDPAPAFYRAKGLAERLLDRLERDAEFRGGAAEPYLHPGASCEIVCSGRRVGAVGEIHPETARAFGLESTCAMVDLDLSCLADLPKKQRVYREVSRHPQVARDLAVLLDARQAAGEVVEAIRKTGGGDLTKVEVFDRYEGKGVPEGKVSLAFRLTFQRIDRTLKDAEVAKATDRIVQMIAHRFGGELR